MEPQEQSAHDRAEIKIKVLSNGILVKAGIEWSAFPNWVLASDYIAERLASSKVGSLRDRLGPKGGC